MTLADTFGELMNRWPSDEHVHLLKKWQGYAEEVESAPFVGALEKYLRLAQTFCTGHREYQDGSDMSARRMDLIGGLPYVSQKHPWPRTNCGKYWMQPILQLNLGPVGNMLQRNLGADVLQVWGAVGLIHENLGASSEHFLLRVIPAEHFLEAPTGVVPDWQRKGTADPGIRFAFEVDEDDEETKFYGRAWQLIGPMYGSGRMMWEQCAEDSDSFSGDDFSLWMEELFLRAGHSCHLAQNNSTYLGGVGGQSGGINDASFGEGLLARISDSQGLILSVFAYDDKKSAVNFSLQLTYYV